MPIFTFMHRIKQTRKTAHGFTLVELAIVIMVIGLLIGGIMQGQEMIQNARTNRVVADLYNFQSAIDQFKKIHGELPGDIRNAASRIPGCTTAPCNGNGNGDFRIGGYSIGPFDYFVAPAQSEYRAFWIHLTKTGLLNNAVRTNYTGTPNLPGVDFPSAPHGGLYFPLFNRSASVFPQANMIRISIERDNSRVFTAQQAQQIDRKMDDGLPGTGRILGLDSIRPCFNINDNIYNRDASATCNIAYVIGD